MRSRKHYIVTVIIASLVVAAILVTGIIAGGNRAEDSKGLLSENADLSAEVVASRDDDESAALTNVLRTAQAAESQMSNETSDTMQSAISDPDVQTETEDQAAKQSNAISAEAGQTITASLENMRADGVLDTNSMFTERDLLQTPDISSAQYITVKDDDEINITREGVYVLSGTAQHAVITVEADKEAKVQLVLDGLNITNTSFPCIYVLSGDKVFVTTVAESSLTVTDSFVSDGNIKTDGVIFSKSDLVFNGTAALNISSSKNGIVCKDDLKVTGGTYVIQALSKAIEANDSIRIADGVFDLTAGTDALHAENDEDDSLGYIYICDGEFIIMADDDGIHAVSAIQVDGGEFDITAAEAVEGTYLQFNGGNFLIHSSDDGINAANKSYSYATVLEINDGKFIISMGDNDTDAIDSNGDLYVNGGYIDITGRSAFDCDGYVEYNGGTIIINGEQTDSIVMQQMGGSGLGRGRW